MRGKFVNAAAGVFSNEVTNLVLVLHPIKRGYYTSVQVFCGVSTFKMEISSKCSASIQNKMTSEPAKHGKFMRI